MVMCRQPTYKVLWLHLLYRRVVDNAEQVRRSIQFPVQAPYSFRFARTFFLTFGFDAPGRGISAVGFTLPRSRTASRSESGMWILSPGCATPLVCTPLDTDYLIKYAAK